jgi:hypothetical protein
LLLPMRFSFNCSREHFLCVIALRLLQFLDECNLYLLASC